MKRLLAVSWEMPPMYGARATQVARTLGALVPLGWQPTVVCLDPQRGGPNWRDGIDVALPTGVGVVRVKSPEEWTVVRALWRVLPALRDRPDSKWVWINGAAAAAEEAAARTTFDCLVTFAQPWSDHLVGLRVHRSTKLPWVAHFSDPWVDDPYRTLSESRRAAWSRMEAEVVKNAAAIVFVSEETAALVMAKYPNDWRRKTAVVPHGFVRTPVEHSGGTGRRPGPMRLVHTGRFYDGLRTPLPLLRALEQLNARQPLSGVLEITLVGPRTTQYSADVSALGLTEVVRLRERVSKPEAEAIAADADVLLVIDAPTTIPSPYLPSKLVDYLPFRKPLFGITPAAGASAALLKRLGASIAVPEDEVGIRNALQELSRLWREGTLRLAPEFDRVADEYDISRTTARFDDVLTGVSGGRR